MAAAATAAAAEEAAAEKEEAVAAEEEAVAAEEKVEPDRGVSALSSRRNCGGDSRHPATATPE